MHVKGLCLGSSLENVPVNGKLSVRPEDPVPLVRGVSWKWWHLGVTGGGVCVVTSSGKLCGLFVLLFPSGPLGPLSSFFFLLSSFLCPLSFFIFFIIFVFVSAIS
jgi:hypothetical protein